MAGNAQATPLIGQFTSGSQPVDAAQTSVTFPSHSLPGRANEPHNAEWAMTETTRTILVVDDYDAIRRLVCRAVERRGDRALVASSADEARKILNSTHVDLLLTDVGMPIVTGIELAAGLASEHPNLPVIFMSGRSAPRDLRPGGRRLMFLRKPFTVSMLWHAIDQVFGLESSYC